MNGVQSAHQVAELMSSSHSAGLSQPHHTAAFIEAAAHFNTMSADELLHRHSFYPMLRGFHSNGAYSELGQRERVNMAKLSIRNMGRRARLCPTCAEDDLRAHKFSYWRKRHHLPGRFSCPAHGCGLLLVDDSVLMDQMPHEVVDLTSGVDKANRSKFISNPHILLALDILEQLNDHHAALDRDACMAAFRTEIRAQGQEPSQPRWFSDFSASIDAAFTLDWLHAAFPRSRFKAGTIRNFAIGCITDRTIQVSNMAMAATASMLFPSSSAALSAITGEAGNAIGRSIKYSRHPTSISCSYWSRISSASDHMTQSPASFSSPSRTAESSASEPT